MKQFCVIFVAFCTNKYKYTYTKVQPALKAFPIIIIIIVFAVVV